MHITFTPEDGEKREWDFKLRKILTTEAEAIEKRAGIPYIELNARVLSSHPTARRALIWVLLKRTEPTLQYVDVDFEMGAFQAELDDEEKADLRAQLDRAGATPDERRIAMAEIGILDDEPEPGPKEDPAGTD